ncbi:MAG TPA: dienelactone hydrolase family protein [Tepidisphaeraceae bacterium]|jgi:dienelactone hydrolase|nr:dienelactone hydrolase family protein [Tepidisphaeraceae bacterium]
MKISGLRWGYDGVLKHLLFILIVSGRAAAQEKPRLPGTEPLVWDDDIASRMVAGIDRFLLREIEKSNERRGQYWKRDYSSAENYQKSMEPNRRRLAHILGVGDQRRQFAAPEIVASVGGPSMVGETESYTIFAIRWPVVRDVWGEGLLLEPKNGKPVASVVALADADQLPEQICGLADGVPADSQYARRLAESGCRVVVPVLIDRHKEARNGRANLSSREFLYRPSFELGRHLIGYEVQKVLAAVDWVSKDGKVGVFGRGEGGMLALYSAALDGRIQAVCISGYFGDRREIWQQPIDRNVFGLLEQFGDAELAAMVTPRVVIVEIARGPEAVLRGEGGAPAELATPGVDSARSETERARSMAKELGLGIQSVARGDGSGAYGSEEALRPFLEALSPSAKLAPMQKIPVEKRANFDPAPRQARQMHQIEEDTQWLLEQSAAVRVEFMKKLNTKSPEEYAKTSDEYRKILYEQVIGKFDYPLLTPRPRTRLAYETEKWRGYEVVIDVFEDVFAYGVLLLPNDLKEGEKRPVVVCQHGLEGRPADVITGNKDSYHDFAAKLAERGFITFAPQNPYIFTDRFRSLQRKANPLGKSLFSIITPQHQAIINWLKTQPNVHGKRIGFYGLSYGGKTAMRVPALLTDYCLSICSADFNEWVWKNASTRSPYSYVWTGEYEIFEFDLGSTFNYAEMAALIAPRPFMVERGHFDGVAPDEKVGHEFAKVRHLYEARLGLKDMCEIEWFVGPHTINGMGTFEFLHKHLNWPAPQH